MNKKSIIFIVIAIVLVIVGFSSKNTSEQTDIISKAAYVADGKVLPENEGKIVIVSGMVEAEAPLVDTLTGVEIPHIKANRKVDVYKETSSVDDDGETYYYYDWQPTTRADDNAFYEMNSSVLYADCKVGEIAIDNAILRGISTSKHLYDIDKVGPAENGYNVKYLDNVAYVTELDYLPEGGEGESYGWSASGYYVQYEGTTRISYTIPAETDLSYTFIGRQQNGKLMYDKELGMQAAFDGLQNPEQLSERVESGGTTGAIVAWVLAAFFLFLAIMGLKKKETKSNN